MRANQSDAAADPAAYRAALLCPCGSGLRASRCCSPEATLPAADDRRVADLVRNADHALEAGDAALAESHCLAALDLAPLRSDALWLLHKVRRTGNRLDACVTLLRRLVGVEANHVPATLELATLLFDRGDLVEAEHHARNAVRLAPTHLRSHNILGMVLTEAQRPHVGEHHYRRVLELSGRRDPILLANLAWNLKNQGRIDEARRLYEESAALAPDVFLTWLGWAQLEELDSCLEAAHEKLDRAAALRPDAMDVRIARGRLLARQGDAVGALTALDQPAESGEGRVLDSNALLERGRLLDRLGRHEEAFAHFDEGKRLAREVSGKRYLDQHAIDLASRLKTFFVGHRLRLIKPAPVRKDVAQPIFVLGFPRSGTTLIEQALSNHPRILGGGELPFVNELAEELPRLVGSPLAYPEALSELWMGDKWAGLTTLRNEYLQRAALRGLATDQVPWFTDKMPLNEMHLGLAALMFPQAPLIHVVRHPLDVVLSVYSHHLTHGYFCAYELNSIAEHYALVMDLVEHYRAEMPLRYLQVRYEDVAAQFGVEIGRMLAFIGEPYDERCTRFHDNRRRPQTPSYAQVTEPLHQRSRERYRPYLKALAPAVAILEPLIERLGYSVD